ncbi:hypothetical protein B0H15DRAFT_786216, partial [Mycena belliarum]
MTINLNDSLNTHRAKHRKIDVVLPQDTELDRLLVATLAAGKDEKKKALALFGPVLIETSRIKVTAHGSCKNAGKINAAAGAAIYWGPDAPRNKSIRVHGTQNNARADLTAVISALQYASADDSLEISTRSAYAIRAAKYYAFNNDARGWRCANGDLLKTMGSLIKERSAPVHFLHIKKGANLSGHLKGAKALAK